MGLEPKLLYIGDAGNAPVYTSPTSSGSYTIIKHINAVNTSTQDSTFSLFLVQQGSTALPANAVVFDAEVSSKNVLAYDTSIVIPANTSIFLAQPADRITLIVSGVEYAA
jgi:hypothetical protein